MRFKFDPRKSDKLRTNPKRGIGTRLDLPDQYRAIGWVNSQLYTVIFEIREDGEGEYYHLITLWKATKEERKLYEENS